MARKTTVIQPLERPPEPTSETPPRSPEYSNGLPSQDEPPPARVRDSTTDSPSVSSEGVLMHSPPLATEAGAPIELSVAFSNVNIGDKTASVGISIDRADFSISQADEYLCGHRVGATIIGRPPGNAADQGNLPGLADDVHLSSTFDVKSFRVTRKIIGCSLVVNLADVDVNKFATFAKRNGKFIITLVSDLPASAAKAPRAEPVQEDEDDDEFDTTE